MGIEEEISRSEEELDFALGTLAFHVVLDRPWESKGRLKMLFKTAVESDVRDRLVDAVRLQERLDSLR